MEHIVNFGVAIDDDKIEQMVMDKASVECLAGIRKHIDEFSRDSWNNDSQLKTLFKEEVKKVIEENKDEILKAVINQLTINMTRTKVYREAVERMTDGTDCVSIS